MSVELKDLLTRLLCRIPTERIGKNGAQEIKSHPFFNGVDWSAFKQYNAQGGFNGIFVPRRTKKRFGKKKRARVAHAMEEIADDPQLRPEVTVFRDIEGWSFVRNQD